MERHNPSTYLKLAQTFLSLGDDDLARATCDRGLKRFPTDAGLHTQRGRTLIFSYNKRKNRDDIIQAVKSLERSIAINPDNYLALTLACLIYIKAKAYHKARQKLDMIVASFPGDPKASELLKLMSKAPLASPGGQEEKILPLPLKEQSSKGAREETQPPGLPPLLPLLLPSPPDPEETGLENQFQPFSRPGLEAEGMGEGEKKGNSYAIELEDDDEIESLEDRISGDYALLGSYLKMFKKEQGMEMVLLVDKYGMVISNINMLKRDSSQYGIAVSNIFRSSQNAVRKTGFGLFSKGFLTTPKYKILLVEVKSAILAVFTLPNTDIEGIEKRIDHYLRKIDLKWTSKKS